MPEGNDVPVEIAGIILTAVVGIITAAAGIIAAYLAYSLRRQRALRVAEKRLAAYQALWGKMHFASPVRLTEWRAQPLSKEERMRLFDDFNAWYYENGNGLFLGDSTRAIYLRVKDNLVCPLEYYRPPLIRDKLNALPPEQREEARGYLAIQQLSLLRNRMKADLDVYGLPYHVNLDKYNQALLLDLDEDLSHRPWNRPASESGHASQNVPIFPEEERTGQYAQMQAE